MNRLRCLIIEDEPLAAELLGEYIGEIPYLELINTCENVFLASEILRKEKIDVLFLDLHLPKVKGFDFLRTLKNPPQVIVTTAYHQYALEGYEHGIVDYLLKPIELSRFVQAVQKLKWDVESKKNEQNFGEADVLFVYQNRERIRIVLQDILFIESLRQYIRIHLQAESILVKMSISDMESKLPSAFTRVHKSFIISIPKIQSYNSRNVNLGKDRQIPVGDTYRENFLGRMEGNS